jgi:hypothetical protein
MTIRLRVACWIIKTARVQAHASARAHAREHTRKHKHTHTVICNIFLVFTAKTDS